MASTSVSQEDLEDGELPSSDDEVCVNDKQLKDSNSGDVSLSSDTGVEGTDEVSSVTEADCRKRPFQSPEPESELQSGKEGLQDADETPALKVNEVLSL